MGSGHRGSWRAAIRKAVLAVGILGLAYVVSRRFRTGDSSSSAPPRPKESIDAEPHDVRPGEGRQTFSEEPTEEAVTAAGQTAATDAVQERSGERDETESSTGDEPSVEPDDDLPGDDRSPEEIEERAVDDAQEEPAEPGEMTVDEEVVEGVVDEESESGAGDDEEEA